MPFFFRKHTNKVVLTKSGKGNSNRIMKYLRHNAFQYTRRHVLYYPKFPFVRIPVIEHDLRPNRR